MIPRYSRPELAALWEDGYRFELWLMIELAVCEAMEQAGTVPEGTAAKVRAAAAGKLVPERILEIEHKTRHDVIAFLTHVEELAGEPARWLHLGMTSSDVLDTALALQTGSALDRIISGVIGLANALAEKAREHANTPTIGRSHGIHAEPITAGLVFARWNAEVVRASSRDATSGSLPSSSRNRPGRAPETPSAVASLIAASALRWTISYAAWRASPVLMRASSTASEKYSPPVRSRFARMRAGCTTRFCTSEVARATMVSARIVASGIATRSTLECEISRSCHSATSSSPACA